MSPNGDAKKIAGLLISSNCRGRSKVKTKIVGMVALVLFLLPAPATALTDARWQEIQKNFNEYQRTQIDYKPKVGDVCFASADDMGWMTPADLERWGRKFNQEVKRLNPNGVPFNRPSHQFYELIANTSNGGLVKLGEGIKLRVLEGKSDPGGHGFSGHVCKIQILSGPNTGKVCFNSGIVLVSRYIADPQSFFKTEEEKKASQALFVAKQLHKDVSEELALLGVIIEPPVENKGSGISDGAPANSVSQTADNGDPMDLVNQYANKLRKGSFTDNVNAYLAAQSRLEETIAKSVVFGRIPQTSTEELLSVIDQLVPGRGLYSNLFYYLSNERHVNALKNIPTEKLIEYIAEPDCRLMVGFLTNEFDRRVPKLKDAEIEQLRNDIPPLSRMQYTLIREQQRRSSANTIIHEAAAKPGSSSPSLPISSSIGAKSDPLPSDSAPPLQMQALKNADVTSQKEQSTPLNSAAPSPQPVPVLASQSVSLAAPQPKRAPRTYSSKERERPGLATASTWSPEPVLNREASNASATTASPPPSAASVHQTGSAKVDFGPYMADLQRRLKRAWFPPKGNESKIVKVVFTVHKDGKMTNLRIVMSSGLQIADAAAQKAVENASPFRPLPDGADDEIDVPYTFDYNPGRGGARGGFRQF
jgi:TonB family protein